MTEKIGSITVFALATALYLFLLSHYSAWAPPANTIVEDWFHRVFFFGLGVFSIKTAKNCKGVAA